MPATPPLPARPRDARENRVHAGALLESLLLALLSALFGHARRRAATRILPGSPWNSSPWDSSPWDNSTWASSAWDDLGRANPSWNDIAAGDALPDSAAPGAGAWVMRALLRGWHADCESPILYVIGPGPNRGMRVLPRPTPPSRRETARAPPSLRRLAAYRRASTRPLRRGPRGHGHFITISKY